MKPYQTPAYIVSETDIRHNLTILKKTAEECGAKILLAQKAFSMFRLYPLIGEYLSGATASGLFEAKLCYEEMVLPLKKEGKKAPENHVFEPAYKPEEMEELTRICDHMVFNSLNQLEAHRKVWEPCVKKGELSVGLRVNPEYSTQEGHEIYDPCAKGSRLGIRRSQLPDAWPAFVDGLHFHTLCEQNADPLIRTFKAVEERFSCYFPRLSWINLGGGHHITKDEYDRKALCELVSYIRDTYHLTVYLEPGEAIALDAGTLETMVLDVVETEDCLTLIMDASAACHMPDVLEMPYTPPLLGAVQTEDEAHPVKVRVASRTCLAGDVIGIYYMDHCPKIGEVLTFQDMAIYSMVKNNTFNGMALPDIVLKKEDGQFELVRSFGYEDFKGRLS